MFWFKCLLAAFLLNFVWESWHAVSLYKGYFKVTDSFQALPAPKFVRLMTYVSMVDAVLVGCNLGLVWGLNLLFKTGFALNLINTIIFSIIAMAWAVLVELKGVYWRKEWAYNDKMPRIMGIGLSPLVQLAFTGLLAWWLGM